MKVTLNSKRSLTMIVAGLFMALLAVCHQSDAADLKISNFKFGDMTSSEKVVVTGEATQFIVPAKPEKKNYFGYTFDYSGNFPARKLTTILQLPGKPAKDLGSGYDPSANTVKAVYDLDHEKGQFGVKWNFSQGDLAGKFTLQIFAGNTLLQTVEFEATEDVVPEKAAPAKVEHEKEALKKTAAFQVVEEKDVSRAKIVVQKGVTKEELEQLAKMLFEWKKETIPDMEEALFAFYYPDQDYKIDEPIGSIGWNLEESGKWTIEHLPLKIKQPRTVGKKAPVEIKPGIPAAEKRRRQVYRELVQGDMRAGEEAEKLYPTDPLKSKAWQKNIRKNVTKYLALINECREKTGKKYKLTEEQLTEITAEGVKEKWPSGEGETG